MKISIVTALYQSAPYLREFYERHRKCLEQMGVDYEFIFVNDGSPDDSESIAREIVRGSDRVTLICLSRNFGQHPAMFAGLAQASGDYVYATDCDIEEAPENIVPMFQLLRENQDSDVVYGVLDRRPGGWLRRLTGGAFYRLLDFLSEISVPHNQAWQRIMTRRYVQALLRYSEYESLPAGLMILAGFRQIPFQVTKVYKGTSSYTLKKRIVLAVNSIVSFSSRPLTLICLFGLGVTLIAGLLLVIALFARLLSYEIQVGWLSLVASIWCVGGLMLASIGAVGVYLAKVFNQVKGRPLFVVREIVKS